MKCFVNSESYLIDNWERDYWKDLSLKEEDSSSEFAELESYNSELDRYTHVQVSLAENITKRLGVPSTEMLTRTSKSSGLSSIMITVCIPSGGFC